MTSSFALTEGFNLPSNVGIALEILEYLQSGYEVVHQIKGRIRIRLSQLETNSAQTSQLADKLMAIEGMTQVNVNPLAKSVTVYYEENTEAAQLINSLPAPHQTPPKTADFSFPSFSDLNPVPQADQSFDQVKFWISRFGVILLQIAGAFFLFIGIVGVILPLIPGFPFLILSALCFFAASELALLT